MENSMGNNVLLEENRRLFDTAGRLMIENNSLKKRIEYLEGEIKENNERFFKRKIRL